MAEEIRSDYERMVFALGASQLALWDWDMISGTIVVDDRWAQMLGYEKLELEPIDTDRFLSLTIPSDRTRVFDRVDSHSSGETATYEIDFRMAHKAGHWVWIRAKGLIVSRLEDGTPSRMTGVHEDVTDLKRQQRELLVKSSQLEAAQRLGRQGSWYWDVVTNEVTWSKQLCVMMGVSPEAPSLTAKEHAQFFTPDSWEALAAAQRAVADEGTAYELELELQQEQGPIRWMLSRGEAVRDEFEEIVGVFGIAQDITAKKHSEEALRTMALQDDLSLLGNRQALNNILDNALQHARESGVAVGCIMVDLDDFKWVNDSFGHAAGDEVVRIAANRLAGLTRKSDSAFRLGGDEFVVILESVKNKNGATAIGERIVKAFEQPLTVANRAITITASVGIAFSEEDCTRSALLRKADAALYQSKRTGKNKAVTYTPDLVDSDRNLGA